ncbi:uncharacterized protein A1O9_05551 [Exophiala aquamarina CBS 119918]|uniref:Alpha/beta hydrolase fold-3 domain-containing protein n=1 Tax=Exophiala aquamarina CBS 119918 TaxID=1182545 RepID=A0A072PEB5_9EURO|nr:uncharacterized protein A1O9_05551 [Exophiala aquamarina CBS 119918]KEF57633.1 hypothetical protein A1O9_05551 [Exophiala aquamarina CBS 119918]
MTDSVASLNDPSTWKNFGILEPFFAQVAKDLEKNPESEPSLDNLSNNRNSWEFNSRKDTDNLLDTVKDQVSEQEIFIPCRDGHKTRALLYQPKQEFVRGRPLVVVLHGGGFTFGTAEMESLLCIRATKDLGCVSLSLEYRLAPENKFPTAYEDVWDAVQWIIVNAGSIGADLSEGFVLGGCSAGGHITIPLSHRARDEKLSPPLTGIYLSVTPALAHQAVTEKYQPLYRSREEFRNGISLTFSSIAFYDKTNEPDVNSPLWSPLLWPTGHANLPPTYFQICGADMLRDEALIYERELRENNVKTKVDIYPGLPHVFWYTHPDHPAVPKYHEDAKNGVGWLLGQRKSS